LLDKKILFGYIISKPTPNFFVGEIPLNLCSKELEMKKPIGTTAKTGEICPESGVWQVVGTPSTTAPIAKSNKMPPYSGRAVTWKLKSYA
jgi:hypothetical protein